MKTITKAGQVPIRRTMEVAKSKERLIKEFAKYESEYDKQTLNTFEIIGWLLKRSPSIINLIWNFVKLTEEIKMFKKDPKTTILAILKIICSILAMFGIIVPEEVSTALVALGTAGYFLFDFIQGLFTKDKEDKPKVD